MTDPKGLEALKLRAMGPFLFVVFAVCPLWAYILVAQGRSVAWVAAPWEKVGAWLSALGLSAISRLPGITPFSRAMMELAAGYMVVYAIVAEYSGLLSDSTKTVAITVTTLCCQVLSLLVLRAEIRRRRRPPDARADKNPQESG